MSEHLQKTKSSRSTFPQVVAQTTHPNKQFRNKNGSLPTHQTNLDLRLMTPAAILYLQRTIGNSAARRLSIDSATHPTKQSVQTQADEQGVIQVGQRGGNHHIQRVYLDNATNFSEALVDDDYTADNLLALMRKYSFAFEDFADNNGHEEASNCLSLLSHIQREFEKWKFEFSVVAKQNIAICNELDKEIKLHVEQITSTLVKPDMTGAELAKAKEAELLRLAMRTIVGNVGDYGDKSSAAQARWEMGKSDPDRKYSSPAPVGVTPNTLKQTAAEVEDKAAGVCTNFAYAAAAILQGNGVRVDVVSGSSGSSTGHAYVVLGRKGSDIFDINSWGENRKTDCKIIDCWNGAVNWANLNTLPQVIYDFNHWDGNYTIDTHTYDSEGDLQRPATRPRVGAFKLTAKQQEENQQLREQMIEEANRKRAEKDAQQRVSLQNEGANEEEEPIFATTFKEAQGYGLWKGAVFKIMNQPEKYEMIAEWDPTLDIPFEKFYKKLD